MKNYNWKNLEKATTPASLTGYMGLGLTMAKDEDETKASLTDQKACYIAMLFMQSVDAPQNDSSTGFTKAYQEEGDSSFETLCKQIFRWAIAAIQSGPITSEQVDQTVVTTTQLADLLTYLSDESNPIPISADDIEAFMQGQFIFNVAAPTDEGQVNATYFPMVPEMQLTLPDYGTDYKGINYTFADYNTTSSGYLDYLRTYFGELAVKVQKEEKKDPAKIAVLTDADSPSLGSFLFSDYFLLICKQMIQTAQDSLQHFKYYLQAGQTVDDMVNWANDRGQLSGLTAYTVEELFTDNSTVALNTGKALKIQNQIYVVQAADTFASIASSSLFNNGMTNSFTGKGLAQKNAATQNLLQAGIEITYPDKESYTTQSGQSLDDISQAMGVSTEDLITQGNILTLANLLLPAAILQVPITTYTIQQEDTFTTIASQDFFNNAFTAQALAQENAAIKNLLQPNIEITYPDKDPYTTEQGQSIDDIAQAMGVSTNDLIAKSNLITSAGLLITSATLQVLACTYVVHGIDTFTTIAQQTLWNNSFTPQALAEGNAATQNLLQADIQITYPDKEPYTTKEDQSIDQIAHAMQVAIRDLIANSNILTLPGLLIPTATLQVPLFIYATTAGDTFTNIAEDRFKAAFTAQAAALANAYIENLLKAGSTITYPGKADYTTHPGQSLQQIALAMGVSTQDLIEKSNVINLSDLLLPSVLLQLPSFTYTTLASDNLKTVAAQFNITQKDLASPVDNIQLADLFDQTTTPALDIAELSQFEVGELIKEIQATQGLQHLAGMTSRYCMAGLRLPTQGITPNYPGMWVTNGGTLTLPEYAGVYALTGQQFPIPTLTSDNFDITFTNGSLNWLQFDNADPTQLTISIVPDSSDAKQITSVQTFAHQQKLDTDLSFLGVQDLFKSQAATYSFASAINWASASPISMPYGGIPTSVSDLKLWKLPHALAKLPNIDPQTANPRKINPRVTMQLGQYNAATQAMVNHPINYYGYASQVEFTIKKIPVIADSPSTQTTYEVMGTDGSHVAILEKILTQIDNNDQIASLLLAYNSNSNSSTLTGIQTDAIDKLTIGLAQVNLSTETRPDTAFTALFKAEPADEQQLLLNEKLDFIRLLWQASITRAGGYYLYYFNADDNAGLPDRIFNDKNEATLSLIVLYPTAPQNDIASYINTLATAEAIDTSNAVLFAEAISYDISLPSSADQTLKELAYQYFGNVGDIAQANASLTLRNGIQLKITEGTYEVGPAGTQPGGSLAALATYFGTTIDAIKAANSQQKDWPDPLPLFTSLRLPPLAITVGTSPGGTTLQDMANYYGQNLTSLASHNQSIEGIFADNEQLTISTGPMVRNATVPAGVVAVEAIRPVPPEIPDVPTADNYGEIYLKNVFSLLAYQVEGNAYFNSSNLSLPASPTTTSDDPANLDKIRAPKTLQAGVDNWEFRQAIPYNTFSKQTLIATQGMPDSKNSPYKGLGDLLQVDFAWQDLYGNRLISALSQPAASDNDPLNQPPILTGYIDPLIALSQWPSVAADWQVITNQGKPVIEVGLSFDPTRYNGLIAAKEASSTTILAQFNETLDETTASTIANYQLNEDITIQKVVLNVDQQSVTLTVDEIPQDTAITLTISNISNQAKNQTFAGIATFNDPNPTIKPTSSLLQQIQGDLQIYTQLWYQLTDPNGVDFTVVTDLVNTAYTLTTDQVNDLVQTWIADIYQFIANRAQEQTSVAAPETPHRLSFAIDEATLNTDQIFKLGLSFTITRTGGAVMGDFETTGGIKKVTTTIAPLSKAQGEGNTTKGLLLFAQNFENALLKANEYQLKIATGVDRHDSSNSKVIWVVRLGLDQTTSIGYQINNVGAPDLFAPRPASNQLESRTQVPIYDFNPQTGIDFDNPSRQLDFTSIDIDLWCQQIFSQIDNVLAPEFTAATQLVDHNKGTTHLQTMLGNKELLADLIKVWMISVFEGESATPDQVQETFKQQLLVKLSNAYNVKAGIQYSASVEAEADNTFPPQLFGNITQTKDVIDTISMTSPKLTLENSENAPLPFLLSSPQIVRGNEGEVLKYIDLNISYEGSAIEHQIGTLPNIQGYEASTWLTFVDNTSLNPLVADLGEVQVPLPLRSFPATPSMVNQIGEPSNKIVSDDISKILQWDYSFTYSQSFHYPQDQLDFTIHFNVLDKSSMLLADIKDAFPWLAQFITVFPEVDKQLNAVLAKIDATTTEQDQFDQASVALEAFNAMVEKIITASQDTGLQMPDNLRAKLTSNQVAPYKFTIQESVESIKIGDKEEKDILLITITGKAPAGIDAPEVQIEGYTMETYQGAGCTGDYCYYYTKDGKPLTATEGQAIAEREVVLPKMNILARQDVNTTVELQRNVNLVPGKTTNDPFKYTTGEVGFANPYHPYTVYNEAVDISMLNNPSGGHNTITLQEHLTNLFTTLLEQNTQDTLSFLMSCHYTYQANTGLQAITLPVVMQPLQEILVKNGITSNDMKLADMINDWASSILSWFAKHNPNKTTATFYFDLTIYANLTQQPMPLVRLTQLTLAVDYITDL